MLPQSALRVRLPAFGTCRLYRTGRIPRDRPSSCPSWLRRANTALNSCRQM